MANIKDAAQYAHAAHKGQKYGNSAYTYHLAKVAKNAAKYGGSANQQMAAWLHDTIEDTPVTKADIAKRFGGSVATIVDLVSNASSKESTYQRIRSNSSAVFVKLCDRLANVQSGAKNRMYAKQYPLFRQTLYRKGEHERLWQEIDKILHFRG